MVTATTGKDKLNFISIFFQEYIILIVNHATILEELKQKHQSILACQCDNAAAKTEKQTKACQMKVQTTEKTKH